MEETCSPHLILKDDYCSGVLCPFCKGSIYVNLYNAMKLTKRHFQIQKKTCDGFCTIAINFDETNTLYQAIFFTLLNVSNYIRRSPRNIQENENFHLLGAAAEHTRK